MKTMILRETSPLSSSKSMIAAGATYSAPVSLEVLDLSPADRASLVRDPSIVARAPSVPLKLIHPASARAVVSEETPPAVSWGLQEIGAVKSGFTGSGIRVAVLDTYKHSHQQSRLRKRGRVPTR